MSEENDKTKPESDEQPDDSALSDPAGSIPERIYLQWDNSDMETTWSRDRVNENDVEYRRANPHLSKIRQMSDRELADALTGMCADETFERLLEREALQRILLSQNNEDMHETNKGNQ